jgi:hypothetical protein
MTMAVFFGSQLTVFSMTCHSLVSAVERTRARVGSDSSGAALADASWTDAAGNKTRYENTRSSDEFIELDRRQATQARTVLQLRISS